MVNRILRKIGGERPRKRKSEWKWPSETSKRLNRLAPYCKGYGLDLGFGGDPITPHAIRADLPTPYTEVEQSPVQLGGDAGRLIFIDGDHSYEGVKTDFELCAPFLSPNALVLFHDSACEHYPNHVSAREGLGVPRYLDELQCPIKTQTVAPF